MKIFFARRLIIRAMTPLLVLNIVGLTRELLRKHPAHTPNILALAEGGDSALLGTVLPAVTCTVQSTFLTGLLPRFEGRLFSAYEVGIWKPNPGLFLHAARTMGAEPVNCTVVEDSVPGVQAGVAAGMRVLGYAHADAEVEVLQAAGAKVFRSMAELPGLLG